MRHILIPLLIASLSTQMQTGRRSEATGDPVARQAAGIVVEHAEPGSEAERAGLQAGDILQRWSRGSAAGVLNSPFELDYAEQDQGSRGEVRIEGWSRGKQRTWLLRAVTWGIQTRPEMPQAVLSLYLEGRNAAQQSNGAEAIRIWQSAASTVRAAILPWLLSRIAQQFAEMQQWEKAGEAYRLAIEAAEGTAPQTRTPLLKQWANMLESRDDLVGAELHYREMIDEIGKTGPDSMAAASALVYVGIVQLKEGNFAAAEDAFHRALQIQQRLAPESAKAARTLENLGVLLQEKGNLAEAEYYYRRALTIEQNAPFALRDSPLIMMLMLRNLGVLQYGRGDTEGGCAYFRKALLIGKKESPEGLEVATIFTDLSYCMLERGNAPRALEYANRALAIRRKQSPESLALAFSLIELGCISETVHDLTKAEQFYREALTIEQRSPPPHPELGQILLYLGGIVRKRGELAEAEGYFRRALEIIEKTSPESSDHAFTLASLADVLKQKQQNGLALQLYEQALAEFEKSTDRLGGTEADLIRFREQRHELYTAYLGLLAEENKIDLAFKVSEASHARALSESLASAHLEIRQGVSSALLESERTLQTEIHARKEKRLQLLQTKSQEAQAQIDKEIKDLLNNYKEIQAQIRSASPAYAGLVHPEPLTAEQVQKLLDHDTVLLEYSLGEERSYVWVVSENSVAGRELAKRSEIETLARRVYSLLNAQNHVIGGESASPSERQYAHAAAELSQMVLGPVASLLHGKRLLIVSDGALHYVPFAALPEPQIASSPAGRPGTGTRLGQRRLAPLIVEHEVVNLPSASVLAEIRREEVGREEPRKAFAVLADPVFDVSDERVERAHWERAAGPAITKSTPPLVSASLSEERLTRSARDVGLKGNGALRFSRLLGTRREAQAIMAVTPSGQGMNALDFQATRDRAMSADLAQYRVVHFATHGLLDSQHPEFSGLVLSLVNKYGKRQQGFLDLEDIYNLKLPVDLVVLSGCQTGLGRQVSGEGLIGLTRGFMYAGASRVMASLWAVSDVATAELMARFYQAMEREKMRPAAALRKAQIQMWKNSRWRSPYYWAAFQIQGDWN